MSDTMNETTSGPAPRPTGPESAAATDRPAGADKSADPERSAGTGRPASPDKAASPDRAADPDRAAGPDRPAGTERAAGTGGAADLDRPAGTGRAADPDRSVGPDRLAGPDSSADPVVAVGEAGRPADPAVSEDVQREGAAGADAAARTPGAALPVPVAEPAQDPAAEIDRLGRRMDRALGGFVDDPRRAVREADAVLEDAAQRLARLLAERRRELRESWHPDGGEAVGTEELRIALTRYRDMTRQLLTVA